MEGTRKGVRKQAVKRTKPITFYSRRKYVVHNTPFCHKEGCQEHTVANIKHIICHDPEACEALDNSMNKILETNKVKLEKENKLYWQTISQDVVLTATSNAEEITIPEGDKLLAEIWEIKESHLKERVENERLWRPHGEVVKKQRNNEKTKWQNLMPKKVFENLKKELGTPAAIKVAKELTINQLEEWRKMKGQFWKTKYQKLAEIMNIHKVRIQE